MAKSSNPVASKPSKNHFSPLGSTVLMRAAVWKNGTQEVVALVTGVDDAAEIELNGADYIISVTAFPPGMSSRIMQQIPLYKNKPEDDSVLCAWLR